MKRIGYFRNFKTKISFTASSCIVFWHLVHSLRSKLITDSGDHRNQIVYHIGIKLFTTSVLLEVHRTGRMKHCGEVLVILCLERRNKSSLDVRVNSKNFILSYWRKIMSSRLKWLRLKKHILRWFVHMSTLIEVFSGVWKLSKVY